MKRLIAEEQSNVKTLTLDFDKFVKLVEQEISELTEYYCSMNDDEAMRIIDDIASHTSLSNHKDIFVAKAKNGSKAAEIIYMWCKFYDEDMIDIFDSACWGGFKSLVEQIDKNNGKYIVLCDDDTLLLLDKIVKEYVNYIKGLQTQMLADLEEYNTLEGVDFKADNKVLADDFLAEYDYGDILRRVCLDNANNGFSLK